MSQQSTIYDGQFRGNVLIVGKTGCRKTYFVQKLAVNKRLGKIVKAEWISSIQRSKTREAKIQSCFDCDLSFHYLQNLETFTDSLEDFNLKKSIDDTDSIDNNSYGENKKTRNKNLEKNISQTNIFSIFPASVPFQTIAKILQANVVRTTAKYLPARSLWINNFLLN